MQVTREYNAYQEIQQKLQDLCFESGLDLELDFTGYPLRAEIRPNEEYAQITILAVTGRAGDEKAASMRLTLEGGDIQYTADDGFSIPDKIFAKIRSLFRKLTTAYLQYFFRAIITDPGARTTVRESVGQ